MKNNNQNTPQLLTVKRGRGRPKKVNAVVSVTVLENTALKPTDEIPNRKHLEQAAILLRDSGALFDTLDLETYKMRLDNFTINELNNEAFRVGLGGGADRYNTTRAIMEIFNDYRRKFSANFSGFPQNDNLSPEKKKTALDLMRDGK